MIDLQEVKEYLRVDIEEDDQLLQMLITADSRVFEKCNRQRIPGKKTKRETQ